MSKFIYHFAVAWSAMIVGLLLAELLMTLGPWSLFVVIPFIYAFVVTSLEKK